MGSRLRTHLLLQALQGLEPENSGWSSSSWNPRVDIYELADAIFVLVEAPGLRMEHLRLHFEPGELAVEGTRERPALPGDCRAALVEMNYGPFRRRFSLPADVDDDGIQAQYEAGILRIRLQRKSAPPPTSRRVPIG